MHTVEKKIENKIKAVNLQAFSLLSLIHKIIYLTT